MKICMVISLLMCILPSYTLADADGTLTYGSGKEVKEVGYHAVFWPPQESEERISIEGNCVKLVSNASWQTNSIGFSIKLAEPIELKTLYIKIKLYKGSAFKHGKVWKVEALNSDEADANCIPLLPDKHAFKEPKFVGFLSPNKDNKYPIISYKVQEMKIQKLDFVFLELDDKKKEGIELHLELFVNTEKPK